MARATASLVVSHDGITLGGFPHTKAVDLAASSGASLVGYLPAGAGAVATTVQSKLRESVSVKDFGAVGDGVTDDRLAIQAAMDAVSAAGGGEVWFPPGVYRISSFLLARNGVALIGHRGASEIRLDQGVSAQMLANENQVADIPVDDFGLINLTWNANATGTEMFSQSAVAVNGVRRFYARGCVFENATGYGLGFQAKTSSPSSINGPQSDIWIEDCVIRNNGFNGTGSGFDGMDFKSTDRLFVKNCIAHNNAQKGFNFRGFNVNAEGLIAYSNGQQGVEVGGGGDYGCTVNLSNIHAYSNTLEGVTVAISDGVSGRRMRVALSNVNSHENARSGLRVYENTSLPLFGEFEVTVNGAILWNNTEYGFINSSATVKGLTVVNVVATGNTLAGIYNNSSNAVFAGCVSATNATFGYQGVSGRTGNQFVGGSLSGNTSGPISQPDTVNVIGVEGSNSLYLSHLTNAVNFLQIEGRTAGGGPRVSAQGSDTNIELSLSSKGSGLVRLFRNNFTDEMLRVIGIAGATSYFQLAASTVGRPQIQGAGTAADVDVEFVPKGAGKVRFGTLVASADAAVSGYIEVKDAGGTVRKLAVIS